MPYLVYEQDPLIRSDLYETIVDAFNDVVHMIPTLADAPDVAASGPADVLLILSVASGVESVMLPDVLDRLSMFKVIVIGNRQCHAIAKHPACVFVERPFTSDGIVAAIRSATASPPTSPQGMPPPDPSDLHEEGV